MTFIIRENRIETENKTIRIPLPLINEIEKQIVGKNISFSKFVIQACEYALENMENEQSTKNKSQIENEQLKKEKIRLENI